MLRRAENVRLGFNPSMITGKGRITVNVGNQFYRLPAKIHKDQWAEAWQAQHAFPVYVITVGERSFWHFQDRFYWENDGLSADEVYALLVTKQQRERQRIERAQAIVSYGGQPSRNGRQGIPDDVKQLVWTRDGGSCRNCGSTVELQYDHIIPVALGGSTSEDNLQILCGPCNRRKGAGLTIRETAPAVNPARRSTSVPPWSATPQPPRMWYPRPGWGTVRNYQTRPAANGLIDLEAYFVPDDGSQPQYVTMSGVLPEASMGEYARGTFDGETLEIKVGAEVMREAEADTFRKVNSLPLVQRQQLIADLGSLGGDAGWTVTPEWQLVPTAPGLL